MVRLQIVEREGAELHKTLLEAIRSRELRTFVLKRRGRRVEHVRYPGWMNWTHRGGILDCEVLSPRKPGSEWQLLGALVGRLAHRYAGAVQSITIQFPGAEPAAAARRRRRR